MKIALTLLMMVIFSLAAALPVTEKFYFKDSKLVKWIEKDKAVPEKDPRWNDAEKDAAASAKDALEFYPTLKDL